MNISVALSVVEWLKKHVPLNAHLGQQSQHIVLGDVFFACLGAKHDGRLYIEDAIQRGASAIVYEVTSTNDFNRDTVESLCHQYGIPAFGVEHLKSYLGDISAQWYGHPSRSLTVIAVTGTNGKTSCTQWLSTILTRLGQPCGVIGTLGVMLPDGEHIETRLTTPDALVLHRSLAYMVEQGMRCVAIEASSIGLAEGRLDGLHIEVAAITNLTRDHLDYHGTMQAYGEQKARLFGWTGVRACVFNLDDAECQHMLSQVQKNDPSKKVYGYSLARSQTIVSPSVSLVFAQDMHASSQGMVFTLATEQGTSQVSSHLLGEHNVSNLLLVASVLDALGWSLKQIATSLSMAQAAHGRLEPINLGSGYPLVVIDYAHTEDALTRALQALEQLSVARGGKRICVFGCGGDRDKGKRPLMAQSASTLAHEVWVTSDNPRSESPQAIIDDILTGIKPGTRIHVEADRALAIRDAILSAQPNDIVLVAGKGHEAYQEMAGERHPFSDQQHAKLALQAYPKLHTDTGLMTVQDAAISMHGVLHAMDGTNEQLNIYGISTDTRTVKAGDMFFALTGEQFDGHDYVSTAFEKGARVAVVSRPLGHMPGLIQIVVRDTRQALCRLARTWRQRFSIPVVAVVGSNGKTTTKEMIASILKSWRGEDEVLYTQGNLNNEIGVPLSVMALRSHHRCAVFELGMNHPGEIAQLADIAGPTIAIITNAQREHQEFMHTVEATALENGAVIDALPMDGVVVYPQDDAYAYIWQKQIKTRRAVTFGLNAEADVYAKEIQAQTLSTHFKLCSSVTETDVTLPMLGIHHVRNAAAAAAVALAMGVSKAAIVLGLEKFHAVKGRSQAYQLTPDILLIDDSYNANPDSVKAAIDVLAQIPGKKILALGSMAEVGEQGPAMHFEVGEYAKQRGITRLLCYGKMTEQSVEAFGSGATFYGTKTELTQTLINELPGAVLVKGSFSTHMDDVVIQLKTHFKEQQGK